MLSLFRVIASAVFSWLNSLRRDPAERHPRGEGALAPDRDGLAKTGAPATLLTTEIPNEPSRTGDSRRACGAVDDLNDRDAIESIEEAVSGRAERDKGIAPIPNGGPEPPVANAATTDEGLPIGGETEPPTTEGPDHPIDEHPHDAAEHAIAKGDDDVAQLAEAAPTREVKDLQVGEGIEAIELVPREPEGESGVGECERQDREAVESSVAEPDRETEELARETGSDDVGEAAQSIEPPAEVVVEDRAHCTAKRTGAAEDTAEDSRGLHGRNTSESNLESESNGPKLLGAPTRRGELRRTPEYRAPVGGAQPRRPSLQPRARLPQAEKSTPGDRAAPIHVRVVFQRGGYCTVSLLPRRLGGLPERLTVSSNEGDAELVALQDDWYQDVFPDDLAGLLREGSVWTSSDTDQEWVLSGREVFVLAPGTTHRGFVSCARLTVGRNQLVLCTVVQLASVEGALRIAGCAGWSHVHEDAGAPPGWCLLRDVVPQTPVPLSSAPDILNILRPLPEIEIALEGGIRLAHSDWLLGYPPAIQIYGDPEHTNGVLIDARHATVSEVVGYVAPGWDVEGDHQISCNSTHKRYSLVRSQPNWAYWPAYSLTTSGAPGDDRKFEFCGPLVRLVVKSGQSNHRRVVQVPATNPILLGACPGQVFSLRARPDLRGAQCLGLPPFNAVWALPHQPLHCDKRANRILLVEESTPEVGSASPGPVAGRHDAERWCLLILEANRKGLAIESATPEVHVLWREYKKLAKDLWRKLR